MKPVVRCPSNEEQRPQLAPGMLVYYQEDPGEWLSSSEGDPMLVLEVGRICDLTMMPSKLDADWLAAWVLRSDGIRRAYPLAVLTLVEW